jgi:hypothetical protein
MPSAGQWFWHPLQSFSEALEIFKMHIAYESEETARRRAKRLEETHKTKAFRVAHGMEPAEGQGPEVIKLVREIYGDDVLPEGIGDGAVEKKRKPLKKWLGIW